jgi:hypothetical protein
MIQPGISNLPISGGAKNAGHSLSAAIKLSVWLLEIVSEAVGTCLILIFFAFFQFRHEEPPLGNDLSWYKVAGISAVVLIEFAMTGYLATTLISRFALRGRMQRLYPYACAGLYLLHSTIFFVAAGNPLLRVEDLQIQLPGAVMTLAFSWGGNRLVVHWNDRSNLGHVRL